MLIEKLESQELKTKPCLMDKITPRERARKQSEFQENPRSYTI